MNHWICRINWFLRYLLSNAVFNAISNGFTSSTWTFRRADFPSGYLSKVRYDINESKYYCFKSIPLYISALLIHMIHVFVNAKAVKQTLCLLLTVLFFIAFVLLLVADNFVGRQKVQWRMQQCVLREIETIFFTVNVGIGTDAWDKIAFLSFAVCLRSNKCDWTLSQNCQMPNAARERWSDHRYPEAPQIQSYRHTTMKAMFISQRQQWMRDLVLQFILIQHTNTFITHNHLFSIES